MDMDAQAEGSWALRPPLVEVVTASGNIYIGEGYTGSDGTSVYWFSPKRRDGYGTYQVFAYGDNGVYVDVDTTTFTVTR